MLAERFAEVGQAGLRDVRRKEVGEAVSGEPLLDRGDRVGLLAHQIADHLGHAAVACLAQRDVEEEREHRAALVGERLARAVAVAPVDLLRERHLAERRCSRAPPRRSR
jgi:hypothetical protein